jgi:hypothetical protein
VKRSFGTVVGAALVAASAGPALAQTLPLLTEPALTAPAGTLVFETGFDVITDEPSSVTGALRTGWAGPLLRLVYSPAANTELDLEWVARVGERGEEGRNDAPSSDFGDVTLRAKWRILDGGARGPTVGARFGVALPETSFEDEQSRPLGLGPNTLRMFVEALLTQPFGRARLHVDLGLFLQDEVFRPHEQRDFLSFGVAVEAPVGGGLALLAEVAGQAGRGMPGTEPHREARAGLRLGSGRLKWDAAVRRGIAEADGTWGVTAGLTWTALAPTGRP